MAWSLYCLLAGNDRYQQPMPRLDGCINDIDAFVRARAKADKDCVKNPPVRDKEATRDPVIESFNSRIQQTARDLEARQAAEEVFLAANGIAVAVGSMSAVGAGGTRVLKRGY